MGLLGILLPYKSLGKQNPYQPVIILVASQSNGRAPNAVSGKYSTDAHGLAGVMDCLDYMIWQARLTDNQVWLYGIRFQYPHKAIRTATVDPEARGHAEVDVTVGRSGENPIEPAVSIEAEINRNHIY